MTIVGLFILCLMNDIENSVDCVLFGSKNGKLFTLLIERRNEPQKGLMALPGDFVYKEEDIDASALRTLKAITNLENIYLEQIRAFGNNSRYPDQRVITIGYYALINLNHYTPIAGHTAERLGWCDITALPKLAFDHHLIIDEGHAVLKRKVRHEPIGFNLLPELFSLTELQQLYESVLQAKLNKRNFRAKIEQMKILIDSGKKQEKVSHKPAKLYRFDLNRYNMLKKEGFHFKI